MSLTHFALLQEDSGLADWNDLRIRFQPE